MCYHHHIWLVSTFWVYKKANRATEQIWHLSAWKPKYCLLGHSDVAPQHITDSVLTEQTRGQEKLNAFVQSRLIRKYLGFHYNLQQSKSPTLKPCTKYRPRTYHTKINWSKQIETCSNACSFQKMLVVMLIWRKSFPMNCHQFYSLWQTHQDLYGHQTKQFLDKFFSQCQLWKISFQPHISNHVW